MSVQVGKHSAARHCPAALPLARAYGIAYSVGRVRHSRHPAAGRTKKPGNMPGLLTSYCASFFLPKDGVSSKKFQGLSRVCTHSVGMMGHSSARATWVVPVVIHTTLS